MLYQSYVKLFKDTVFGLKSVEFVVLALIIRN